LAANKHLGIVYLVLKSYASQNIVGTSVKHFLPAKAHVLEIGSGPGTDWSTLQSFYKITGSDNSPEFLKHLNDSFPDGEFLLSEASTLKNRSKV